MIDIFFNNPRSENANPDGSLPLCNLLCPLSFYDFSTKQRPPCSNPYRILACSAHNSSFLPLYIYCYRQKIRLRACAYFNSEVIAVQFWDTYYLEKIQEMKAQRKAELEEVGEL